MVKFKDSSFKGKILFISFWTIAVLMVFITVKVAIGSPYNNSISSEVDMLECTSLDYKVKYSVQTLPLTFEHLYDNYDDGALEITFWCDIYDVGELPKMDELSCFEMGELFNSLGVLSYYSLRAYNDNVSVCWVELPEIFKVNQVGGGRGSVSKDILSSNNFDDDEGVVLELRFGKGIFIRLFNIMLLIVLAILIYLLIFKYRRKEQS